MSVNVPVSVWRRTSGNGELGTTEATLTTLSGNQLTTLSGNNFIALSGSYTETPASVWETVTTTPATVWRPTDGNSEFDNGGKYNIVDPVGDYLVDTDGDGIVDTGVTETMIPDTIWEEDDSL